MAELFDEHGFLLPIAKMPDHMRRAIVSVEVVKRNLTAGDGPTEQVHKIKLVDKGRMHELLARHVGLLDARPIDAAQGIAAFTLPSDTPGVSVH